MTHRLALFLVLVGCSPGVFGQKAFGDWFAGVQDDKIGLYAATVNDSKGVLGQYCFFEDNNCLWLLKTDIECEEGSTYPVLVNSDAGASHKEVYCGGLKSEVQHPLA